MSFSTPKAPSYETRELIYILVIFSVKSANFEGCVLYIQKNCERTQTKFSEILSSSPFRLHKQQMYRDLIQTPQFNKNLAAFLTFLLNTIKKIKNCFQI